MGGVDRCATPAPRAHRKSSRGETDAGNRRSPMNAIKLLKQDHKAVEALFKQFEKAGENAHKQKRDLADRIVHELAVHAAIEEQLLYPAARAVDERMRDDVLEALEEHHVAKWTLKEIDEM